MTNENGQEKLVAGKLNENLLGILAAIVGVVLTAFVVQTGDLDISVSASIVRWIVRACIYTAFSAIGLLFLASTKVNLIKLLLEDKNPIKLAGLAVLAGLWLQGFALVIGQ